MNNAMKFFWIIVLIIIVVGGIYWGWTYYQQPKPVVCTQDAKVCPDGSSVGRVLPDCDFKECPSITHTGWLTSTDAKTGLSFQYPSTLGTQYISLTDWPPKIQVLNTAYVCTAGGSEIMPAGQTAEQTINGRKYCVTKESEGAAGSIYTMYAYATPIDLQNLPQTGNGNTIIFTFSLRFVQCANYDEPNRTACENERASFTVDNTVDQIVKTLKQGTL
jgi:hypothetical protein